MSLDKGFIIHELEVGENDHVHMFASAHPKVSISYIVKMSKGISGVTFKNKRKEDCKNDFKS